MLPITPFPTGVPEDSRRSTKELVGELLLQGWTVTAIARHLGVSKPTVCFHKRTLGIAPESKFSRRYDWDEIRAYYEAGHSMRACQAQFGFSGAAWSDAVRRGDIDPRARATPAAEVFVADAKRNRYHLKARLIKAGLKEQRCERCGLEDWCGRPLVLELHHVNGDGRDNRLENLELLCPNCHSQTENWGGRARLRAA